MTTTERPAIRAQLAADLAAERATRDRAEAARDRLWAQVQSLIAERAAMRAELRQRTRRAWQR